MADTRVLEAGADRQSTLQDHTVFMAAQKALEQREDVARGLGFLAGVAATLVVGIGVVLLMRLAGG